MLLHEQIKVTTVGADGAAVGSALSKEVVAGRIEAVYVSYAATAPATTDVTLAMNGTPTETILALANTVTARWAYPRRALHDGAGAPLTYEGREPLVDHFICHDHVKVSVAGSNALTDCAVVDLYWSDK